MVPNGTVVTYQGVWPTVDVISLVGIGNSITSAVQPIIASAGFVILGSQSTEGLIADIAASSFNVTLTLQVENGVGYGSVNDIISIIRNAVYQITGQFPLADSIPQVDTSGATPTGILSTPGVTESTSGIGSSISSFFSNLSSTTGISVGLIAVGIVLAFLLFFKFGKASPA
jgi:hypothetical protein